MPLTLSCSTLQPSNHFQTELPAITEIEILVHRHNGLLLHFLIITRCNTVIHMNAKQNLGVHTLLILCCLDICHTITVDVVESVISQPFREHLVPSRCRLL